MNILSSSVLFQEVIVQKKLDLLYYNTMHCRIVVNIIAILSQTVVVVNIQVNSVVMNWLNINDSVNIKVNRFCLSDCCVAVVIVSTTVKRVVYNVKQKKRIACGAFKCIMWFFSCLSTLTLTYYQVGDRFIQPIASYLRYWSEGQGLAVYINGQFGVCSVCGCSR